MYDWKEKNYREHLMRFQNQGCTILQLGAREIDEPLWLCENIAIGPTDRYVCLTDENTGEIRGSLTGHYERVCVEAGRLSDACRTARATAFLKEGIDVVIFDCEAPLDLLHELVDVVPRLHQDACLVFTGFRSREAMRPNVERTVRAFSSAFSDRVEVVVENQQAILRWL